MTDEEYIAWVRGLSTAELARRLKRGGTLFAPNPHLVHEAARRLEAVSGWLSNGTDTDEMKEVNRG